MITLGPKTPAMRPVEKARAEVLCQQAALRWTSLGLQPTLIADCRPIAGLAQIQRCHGAQHFGWHQMIIIDILNPDEVARNHAGKFKIMMAKTLGIDLKKRIEVELAQKLKDEMLENGVEIEVRVAD